MNKQGKRAPATLQAGLAEALGATHLEALAGTARLKRAWPDMVGPMLAAHTHPVAIEGDTLLIAVDHPAMAQQIRFLNQEIREACFRTCRIRGLRRLRTRIEPGAGVQSARKPPAPARRLSLTERKRAARLLRPVTDHKLRSAMYAALIAQLAHQLSDKQDDQQTGKRNR